MQAKMVKILYITGYAICIQANTSATWYCETLQFPKCRRRIKWSIYVQHRILGTDYPDTQIPENHGHLTQDTKLLHNYRRHSNCHKRDKRRSHAKSWRSAKGVRRDIRKMQGREKRYKMSYIQNIWIKANWRHGSSQNRQPEAKCPHTLTVSLAAIDEMNRFIRNLANLCGPSKPLLVKTTKGNEDKRARSNSNKFSRQ